MITETKQEIETAANQIELLSKFAGDEVKAQINSKDYTIQTYKYNDDEGREAVTIGIFQKTQNTVIPVGFADSYIDGQTAVIEDAIHAYRDYDDEDYPELLEKLDDLEPEEYGEETDDPEVEELMDELNSGFFIAPQYRNMGLGNVLNTIVIATLGRAGIKEIEYKHDLTHKPGSERLPQFKTDHDGLIREQKETSLYSRHATSHNISDETRIDYDDRGEPEENTFKNTKISTELSGPQVQLLQQIFQIPH